LLCAKPHCIITQHKIPTTSKTMTSSVLILAVLQLSSGLRLPVTLPEEEVLEPPPSAFLDVTESDSGSSAVPKYFLHKYLSPIDKDGVSRKFWNRDIKNLQDHPSRVYSPDEAKFVLACCLQKHSVRAFEQLEPRSADRPYLIRTIVPHGESPEDLFGKFLGRDDFLFVNYDLRDSMHWSKNKIAGVTLAPPPMAKNIRVANLTNPKYLLTFRGRDTHEVRQDLGQAFAKVERPDVAVEVIHRPKFDYVVTAHEQARFGELSDTAFMLLPRGKEKWSYRFTEAILAGSIPVVIADGLTLPYEELIDWSEASISIPEEKATDADGIMQMLPTDADKILSMRKKVCEIRDKYFASGKLRAEAMLLDAEALVQKKDTLQFVKELDELKTPPEFTRASMLKSKKRKLLQSDSSAELDQEEYMMQQKDVLVNDNLNLMVQGIASEESLEEETEQETEQAAVAINHFRGRLGNNLIQIQNALLFAEFSGISKIHIPSMDVRGQKTLPTDIWEFLERPDQDTLAINASDKKREGSCMQERFRAKDVFFDDFFSNKGRPSCVEDIQERKRVLLQYIKPLVKLSKDNLKLSEDELVIHMRSGDLMSKNMENFPESRQPPCAFYDKIIEQGNEGSEFKNIRIIAQKDGHNPCIDAVVSRHPDKQVIVQNGDRNVDAAALMNARNLVLSTSTFPLMMGMMNENLEKAWFPQETLPKQALPCAPGYARTLFAVSAEGLKKQRSVASQKSWMKLLNKDKVSISQC